MNPHEIANPQASTKPGRFVCETESDEHNHDRRDPMPEIILLPSVEFDPPQAASLRRSRQVSVLSAVAVG